MWITKCGVEEESVDKLKSTLPIGVFNVWKKLYVMVQILWFFM